MKAKTINPDKLLSVSEYARQINKTTQWVYQLIKDGKVEHIKIGTKFFIVKP